MWVSLKFLFSIHWALSLGKPKFLYFGKIHVSNSLTWISAILACFVLIHFIKHHSPHLNNSFADMQDGLESPREEILKILWTFSSLSEKFISKGGHLFSFLPLDPSPLFFFLVCLFFFFSVLLTLWKSVYVWISLGRCGSLVKYFRLIWREKNLLDVLLSLLTGWNDISLEKSRKYWCGWVAMGTKSRELPCCAEGSGFCCVLTMGLGAALASAALTGGSSSTQRLWLSTNMLASGGLRCAPSPPSTGLSVLTSGLTVFSLLAPRGQDWASLPVTEFPMFPLHKPTGFSLQLILTPLYLVKIPWPHENRILFLILEPTKIFPNFIFG